MYKKGIRKVYLKNSGTKALSMPKKWGVTKTEEGSDEHLDKAFVAQLYGFKKYSDETKAYVFLEIARDMIEQSVKKTRNNPYVTEELELAEKVTKAKQLIGDIQRNLDEEFNALDEIDKVIYD